MPSARLREARLSLERQKAPARQETSTRTKSLRRGTLCLTRNDPATSSVVEGIQDMPALPSAHLQHEARVPALIDGSRSCSHSNGTACEVGRHTGSLHHSAHPVRQSLGTDRMMNATAVSGFKRAPNSVLVVKGRAAGAGQVCLHGEHSTDLLLDL